MEALAFVSVLCSSVVSVVYAFLAYKKAKEQRPDPIWEAALELAKQDECQTPTEAFASSYEQLKAFAENGYSMKGYTSIDKLVKDYRERSCTQHKPPSKELQ